MATKQQLYRSAALILKQNSSGMTVSDDEAVVNTFNLFYDEAIRYALASGDWNFATRTVSIEADENLSSAFGYSFVVVKPDDYADRIVAISGNDMFDPPLDGYDEEGGLSGNIFCNVDPLYLRYVSNGVEYGLNLADWPPAFERYFEYELAERGRGMLTNMSAAEDERFERKYRRALQNAKSKDARNQGAAMLPQGRLVQARGWPSTRSRWRY